MEGSAWSSKSKFSTSVVVSPEDGQKKQNDVIRSHLIERKVSKDIAKDKNVEKSFIRNHQTFLLKQK